jgi:hypothetical protein
MLLLQLQGLAASGDPEVRDAVRAQGVRTRIRPGLFDHITTETNR